MKDGNWYQLLWVRSLFFFGGLCVVMPLIDWVETGVPRNTSSSGFLSLQRMAGYLLAAGIYELGMYLYERRRGRNR
jgi:hypothetical protein